MEMNDFKIESKPSTYHAILHRGQYSDYEEKHFFFSANGRDELWNFIKRYVEQTREGELLSYGKDDPIVIVDSEMGKIVIPPTKDYWDDEWTEDNTYNKWDCSIEMLNVIHFRN